MNDPNGRYGSTPTAYWTDASGREVPYLTRRILPLSRDIPIIAEVEMSRAERIDTLAANALGDSDQGWQLADANHVLHPRELEVAGRRIRIPGPSVEGT